VRLGNKTVPYSIVAAVENLDPRLTNGPPGAALLNDWTANELGAKPGDKIAVDYFESQPDGRLVVKRAGFGVVGTTPIQSWASDPHFAPTLPGVTDVADFRNWKVPFDIDRRRIRKQDD